MPIARLWQGVHGLAVAIILGCVHAVTSPWAFLARLLLHSSTGPMGPMRYSEGCEPIT